MPPCRSATNGRSLLCSGPPRARWAPTTRCATRRTTSRTTAASGTRPSTTPTCTSSARRSWPTCCSPARTCGRPCWPRRRHGRRERTAMPELILDGLRVVDLSSGLAGPVATQILAEAGADVVKVESPEGDPVRRLHRSAFATWNRSKHGVVLTLDDPRLTALIATADVLVHDLRPDDARRHGLDDATLLHRYPRLVVSAVTGYPPGHADADRPGHDLLVQARGGYMDLQSGWRGGPFAWRSPAPSWGAAFLAASGILARLFHRERAGTGGAAHTSLA